MDQEPYFSNKSGIVNISGTDFSGNNAANDCGGAVHVLKSKMLIFNSTFSQNFNHHGGALCLLSSTNYLHDCMFKFNEAANLEVPYIHEIHNMNIL